MNNVSPEHLEVEKPFLTQLSQLDWEVFDLGVGIDPATSFCSDLEKRKKSSLGAR